MNLCKLCNKSEANQTGSHLTSCFIVASQIGRRGDEKGYKITEDPNNDYSENKGANEIKEDYIFCLGCEKRLSFLENYFSQEFTNKVDLKTQEINFPVIENHDKLETNFVSCKNINFVAFHLLIYSIIWRASISNKELFARFKLPTETENNIRATLDLFLPDYVNFKIDAKLNNWLKDITYVSDLFHLYPYVILKSDDKSVNIDLFNSEELEKWDKRKTKNPLYFSDIEKSPYHIILNEFIILGFFNNEKIDFEKEDFFKISNKYNLNLFINTKNESPKIGLLKYEDWETILYDFYERTAQNLFKNILNECQNYFLSKGISPTKQDLEKCVGDKINKKHGTSA